ncbi:MAG: transporter substrate-binding domain-containing protein [Spirochaetes bacterium]|nr:transporter substrate-binding domain-containing protein [Spirochaetota bacterium]
MNRVKYLLILFFPFFIIILILLFTLLNINRKNFNKEFLHSYNKELFYSLSLNKSEKEYIRNKKKIKFVTQKNYAPFEFIDSNNNVKGMMVDLLTWISTYYGFEIEFFSTNFKEAQELVLNNNYDGITSLFYSEDRERKFNFTENVFHVPAYIFVSKNRYDINNLNDLFYKKIAMQRGDFAEEFLRKNNIICEIIYVNDFYEAVDILVEEKVDAVIGDEQVVWTHIYNKNFKDRVKVIGEPLYVGSNCFGINREEKVLLSIINKGIKRAKRLGILKTLEKKWIGYSFIEEKEKENFKSFLIIFIFFVLIIFIFIIIFIKSKEQINIYKETNVQRLRKIIDSIPFIIYLINENFIVEEVNKKFINFFNIDFNKLKKTYHEIKNKDINSIFQYIKDKKFYKLNKTFFENYNFSKKYLNILEHLNKDNFIIFYEFAYDDEDVFKSKIIKERECEIIDSQKTRRLFHITKIPIEVNYKGYIKRNVLAIIKDITEERRTENEILRYQKIESVGLLAGKIAHDFNNLLTGICGNLSLARLYLKEETIDEVKELIENTLNVTNHAKSITSQLLAFAKSGQPVKEIFDPINVINSVIDFTIKGSPVSYEIYFENSLINKENIINNESINKNGEKLKKYFIYADKNQFFQALNNIVINAIQANENKGKIKININYSNLGSFNNEKIKENFYIIISVEDEGPGIKEEFADRIFDPFFTTKNFGSGLGLSSVKTICKNHDAYIYFKNKEGSNGAIFYLLFPSTKELIISEERNDNENIYEKLNFKNLNIAIMDDDEVVLNTVKKLFGYFKINILISKNDSELFNILNRNKIDICILDLILPDSLGGAEIINILKLRYPQIFFVVSSGYSSNPVLSNYKEYGFDYLLLKPFNFEDIKELLIKYLENKNI